MFNLYKFIAVFPLYPSLPPLGRYAESRMLPSYDYQSPAVEEYPYICFSFARECGKLRTTNLAASFPHFVHVIRRNINEDTI